jgi:hypothetical protein
MEPTIKELIEPQLEIWRGRLKHLKNHVDKLSGAPSDQYDQLIHYFMLYEYVIYARDILESNGVNNDPLQVLQHARGKFQNDLALWQNDILGNKDLFTDNILVEWQRMKARMEMEAARRFVVHLDEWIGRVYDWRFNSEDADC